VSADQPDHQPPDAVTAKDSQSAHTEQGKLGLGALQPLAFADKAIVDAYTEALKNGISAAADANGVLITASLAIATLYGTLIGLVSPKNQTSPIIVILPMIPLVGAFLAAVYGKTRGISFVAATTTDAVRESLTGVVGRQRLGMRFSVALLTIGLIVGGYVLADVYGRPAPAASVTVYLTPKGQATFSRVCHRFVTSITGSVGTSPIAPQDIVILTTPETLCGGQKLEFAPQDVSVIK
jgi:hypothetical protein